MRMEGKSSLDGNNLAVIGGGRGWGAKIAQAGKRLAAEVHIVEQDTSDATRDDLIRHADSVFFSAPDIEIPNILRDTRGLLAGKRILDCASNKGPFEKTLLEISKEASVCSTHPLVRPETPTRGQNVLIMPLGECPQRATDDAESIYQTMEMRPRRFDFRRHGDFMAIVQFLPHLMQRTLVDALGKVLQEQGLVLDQLTDIAPANFGMTEMGMGRVAIQRPDVSAGIMTEALRSPLGKRIQQIVSETLEHVASIGTDRAALIAFASEGVDRLDPSGAWRQAMNPLTDTAIEARGNFNLRSFILVVQDDKPGLLAQIASLLASFGLNMNAIHSHSLEREEGRGVRFNIGVDQKEVDWAALERACIERGWQFTRTNNNDS